MSSTILALPIQPQISNTNTIITPHIRIIQIPIQNNYQQHQIYVDFSLRDLVPVLTQDNDLDFVDDYDQPMTTCPNLSLNLDNINDYEFKQIISTALIFLGLQEMYHYIVFDDLMARVNEHRSILGQFSLRAVVDIERVTLPDTNEWHTVNNNSSVLEEDGGRWLEAEKGLVRVEKGEGIMLMGEKSNCAICLEELLQGDYGGEFEGEEKVYGVVKLPNCPHVFHSDCICDWFIKSTTCPVCRATCVPVN